MCVPTEKLGVVFLEQGKASQALAYLDKALEFNPEHEQALLNSAILLQELGRADLRKIARERLLKLLTIDGKFAHKFYHRPSAPTCSFAKKLRKSIDHPDDHQDARERVRWQLGCCSCRVHLPPFN